MMGTLPLCHTVQLESALQKAKAGIQGYKLSFVHTLYNKQTVNYLQWVLKPEGGFH